MFVVMRQLAEEKWIDVLWWWLSNPATSMNWPGFAPMLAALLQRKVAGWQVGESARHRNNPENDPCRLQPSDKSDLRESCQ